MIAALQALLPILLVTAVGWLLARSQIVAPEGWAGFETIAYQVFFPSIIVLNLAQAEFSSLPVATLGASLCLAVLAMSALCLALRPLGAARIRLDGPRFTSVLQLSLIHI